LWKHFIDIHIETDMQRTYINRKSDRIHSNKQTQRLGQQKDCSKITMSIASGGLLAHIL